MKLINSSLPILSALLLVSASCTHSTSSYRSKAQDSIILNLPVQSEASGYEQRAIELTNRERKRRGLQPVRFNAQLQHAARRHSAAMAKHGYVGHKEPGVSSNLIKRVKASGYRAGSVRENVYGPDVSFSAIDHDILTPEEAVRQWIASPGHRKNLLSENVTDIGIGYVSGYWTQVLARPDSFNAMKREAEAEARLPRVRSSEPPVAKPFMWRNL